MYHFSHIEINFLFNSSLFIFHSIRVSDWIFCMTGQSCPQHPLSRYRSRWWQERSSRELLWGEYTYIVTYIVPSDWVTSSRLCLETIRLSDIQNVSNFTFINILYNKLLLIWNQLFRSFHLSKIENHYFG